MFKNHYQTLGITQSADVLEIKQAYKKLAVKFHPDKNNGDKYFEERFKEIQESYDILINPQRKKEYDKIYDSFFFSSKKESSNKSNSKNTYRENPNSSYTKEREYRQNKTDKNFEKTEKRRATNVKKNVELAFEDKAWIFIANLTIIGSIMGLFMFIKYKTEGYNKKSSQVCGVSVLGIIVGLILTVIFALGNK